MRISELIDKNGIQLNVELNNQEEAIDKLIKLHETVGNISDVVEFKKAILEREQKGTTAVGNGIAVPHAKSKSVKKAGLVAVTTSGVDYKSLDGKPSNLLFMIAAPENGADIHLEALSKLMAMLMDQEFCNKLINAKTVEEFLNYIDKKEMERFEGEKTMSNSKIVESERIRN